MINLDEVKHNIHKKFEELKFQEDKHEYEAQNKKLKSVSYFIKDYTEEFNPINAALGVAKKTGKTVAQVLQEWENIKNESCALGTKTHLFGEHFVLTGENNPSNGYEEALVKFWTDLPEHLVPVTLELKMYCIKMGIAGTADIILYNKQTNKFIIADYKTNKDLFKNFKGKKLKAPFNNLLDNPFGKYNIQLSMYQILFELTGYEVENRFIIWLKPDAEYEIYYTQDLRKEINNLYNF